MHLRTPLAVLLLAAAMTITSSASARWSGWEPYEKHYLNVYEKCWSEFHSKCGRNIVDDQLVSGKKPTQARVEASSERMTRWLNPPAPAPTPVSTQSAPSTVAPVASSGSLAGCNWSAESGSAGYSAYNPSSGATGKYQILPSTAAAHGCDLSTPAGQDACAAEIMRTEGPGAWSSSGACG